MPTKLATAPTTVATLVTSVRLNVDITVINATRANPVMMSQNPYIEPQLIDVLRQHVAMSFAPVPVSANNGATLSSSAPLTESPFTQQRRRRISRSLRRSGSECATIPTPYTSNEERLRKEE